MTALTPKPAGEARWDLVALGEVMLRLDPGEDRIATARSFRAWEGGGEYNVARGLARCFGMRTAIVTAFDRVYEPSLEIVVDPMRLVLGLLLVCSFVPQLLGACVMAWSCLFLVAR